MRVDTPRPSAIDRAIGKAAGNDAVETLLDRAVVPPRRREVRGLPRRHDRSRHRRRRVDRRRALRAARRARGGHPRPRRPGRGVARRTDEDTSARARVRGGNARPRRHQEPRADLRGVRAVPTGRGLPRRGVQAGPPARGGPGGGSRDERPGNEVRRRCCTPCRHDSLRPVLDRQGRSAHERPRPDEGGCRVDRRGRAVHVRPPRERHRLDREHPAALSGTGRARRSRDGDTPERDAVPDDGGRGGGARNRRGSAGGLEQHLLARLGAAGVRPRPGTTTRHGFLAGRRDRVRRPAGGRAASRAAVRERGRGGSDACERVWASLAPPVDPAWLDRWVAVLERHVERASSALVRAALAEMVSAPQREPVRAAEVVA